VIRDLTLRCKRLRPEATLPVRGSELAAGYDLYAAEDVRIRPGHRAVVSTGIAIELPPGWMAEIRPRSGNSKKCFDVAFGTVDADYRGDIGVQCINSNPGRAEIFHFGGGTYPWEIKRGDRIAQMVLVRCGIADLVDVGDEDLSSTERGAGGFGSTGK
jgi:dUTP pyrophosphatase